MYIKNKKSGIIYPIAIVYRKGEKYASFLNVTLKISGRIFIKYWELIK